MNKHLSKPCTAFTGFCRLSAGPLVEVALAVKNAAERDPAASVLVFDDATGRVVDLDLRGTKADIIARLSQPPADPPPSKARHDAASATEGAPEAEPRGRGRPKLGVVAREVTLLPRHWEWLAAQPGGASVALRKLVDEARRNGGSREQLRATQEAAYRFMTAMAGDLGGFEEATRALFANDRARFEEQTADWPGDVRDYATVLAFPNLKELEH